MTDSIKIEIGGISPVEDAAVIVERDGACFQVCRASGVDDYWAFDTYEAARAFAADLYANGGVRSIDDRIQAERAAVQLERSKWARFIKEAFEQADVPCPSPNGHVIVEIRAA